MVPVGWVVAIGFGGFVIGVLGALGLLTAVGADEDGLMDQFVDKALAEPKPPDGTELQVSEDDTELELSEDFEPEDGDLEWEQT